MSQVGDKKNVSLALGARAEWNRGARPVASEK